ncbi:leucine-rich repeat domain-containing protein [Microlunatus antarcticus]
MRFDDRHEVVVTGPWTHEMAEAVESGVADRVVLNHALGFAEPDLRFLEHLPIRELKILDRRITDLAPVSTLAPTLERLDVEVAPGVPLDLTELPRLRRLGACWSQVSATIGAGGALRRVALDAYDEDDLAPLAGLTNLSAISLKDRPRLRSLAGIGGLVLLTHLGVFGASRLSDVAELQGRDLLERLDLQACRGLGTLDDLASCTGLRTLDVAEGGDLESAAPLAGLVELEELYAYGSTKFVDGDLTPLARLPRLNELRMQSRRHYRPSVPDLKESLAGRAAG